MLAGTPVTDKMLAQEWPPYAAGAREVILVPPRAKFSGINGGDVAQKLRRGFQCTQ